MYRRARRKRASEDSDEDSDEPGTKGEDSDVEMADVNALLSKPRKSDTSEAEKQTRASRLSARTRAKVCHVSLQNRTKLLTYDCRRDFPMGALKMERQDKQYQRDDTDARYTGFYFSDFSSNDPIVGKLNVLSVL